MSMVETASLWIADGITAKDNPTVIACRVLQALAECPLSDGQISIANYYGIDGADAEIVFERILLAAIEEADS